ncbi:MAG: DsbA family protein [Jhaorihella sp.]
MMRLITPAVMAMALLAGPARALDLTSMTETERAAFGAEVRAYLLENPEIIMEAVSLLEQRQAMAEAAADTALIAENADALFDDGHSWVGGNPDGDITLVEFMDYRCGYCRKAAPEVEALLKSDGNIRLIVKEFPILGEASLVASQFALATKTVAGDAAYRQVHDALIAFKGEIDEVALRRLAEGLGLPADAIMAQMDSAEISRILTENHDLARRLNISGTPTFVLGSEMLRGYLPADRMAQMVEQLRTRR